MIQNTTPNKKATISKSYYQKNAFDLDTWFEIAAVDYEKLIEGYPFSDTFSDFSKPELKLLDVGCGTAKFPSLLDDKLEGNFRIHCDLLDVAEYCLQEATSVLRKTQYFQPGKHYKSTVEDIGDFLEKSNTTYDFVWSIHALYTVVKEKLELAFGCILNYLNANGVFFVYQAKENSWYDRAYSLFRNSNPTDNFPFVLAEDIRQTLDVLNANYQSIDISFEHIVPANRSSLLELYLKKMILSDTTDVMNLFADLLPEYYDRDRDCYRFEQTVTLFVIRK